MSDRLRRSAPTQAKVAGLLFGRIDQDVSEIQAFRSVPEADSSNLFGSSTELNAVVERLIASTRKDPEVSALSLLGWYSFRTTGGLHENDVVFHNRFFRQPNEVALILRPEVHPYVLFEIYSKAGANLLSEEEHRWGSLRLATDTTVVGPIDIAMRAKIGDDFYLRAYQVSKTLDRAERREHWMGAVDATRSSFRALFRQKRKEEYRREATGLENSDARVANASVTPAATPQVTPPVTQPATPPSALARAAVAAAAEPPVVSRAAMSSALSPAGAVGPSFSRPSREPAPANARNGARAQRIMAGDPPALPAVIRPPKRSVPWLSSVIVFAIAAGATFALYLQGFATRGDTPRFLRAIFPDTGLSLRVEGQGDRVLLSWNRRNALVRSSQGGVLHIDDGPQHRDVRLDPAQIANGSVLYRPGSDDVSFRLEIHGAQGAAIAETTRVLDGAKVEPLEVKNMSPDVSSSTPVNVPAPVSTGPAPRDQHSRRDERATAPVTPRLTYPAAAPQEQASSEVPKTPEYRPNATRDSAPATASAPPLTSLTSSLSESAGPNTAGTVATTKPAPTSAPTQVPASESRPALTPAQTTTEAPKPLVPAATSDTTRPPDTSKVSNWEDTASSKPAESTTQPRTAPPPAPVPALSRSATEGKAPLTFVPPKPLRQVLPDLRSLTPGAIATASQLEIAVRVNKKGHVTEAYVVGDASKVAPHLARAALNAAKQWTFQPASIRGKIVPSDHTIIFEFRPSSR